MSYLSRSWAAYPLKTTEWTDAFSFKIKQFPIVKLKAQAMINDPQFQWEDTTNHHHKAGTYAYEDESQDPYPYFYLLPQVERKHMQR